MVMEIIDGKKKKTWSQRHRTVSKFALYMVNRDSIPGIPCDPLSPPGVIPECRVGETT